MCAWYKHICSKRVYSRYVSTVNVCTANMYRQQNRHVPAVHVCIRGTFTVNGA